MQVCPNCGEEWPPTASVCTCGTSLDRVAATSLTGRPDRAHGTEGRDRSGPSPVQIVVAAVVLLALVPSVIILARALPSGDRAPSAVDVPGNAPEAQPEQLPDRRERPSIACTGPNVADDCVAWAFTLPGNAFTNYTVHTNDTAVAVRTREDVWLLDLATGEERWHRQESAGTTAAVSVWLAGDMVVLETPDGFRTLDGATGEPAAMVTFEGDVVWMIPDGPRMVIVTQGDDVAVQAWDPSTGDQLWTTRIDIPWASAHVHAHGTPGAQMAVSVSQPPTEGDGSQHTTVDMSTGRIIEDPESDPNTRDSLMFHVFQDGTRLSGGGTAGTVEWQRELDEQYHPPVRITRDHVALYGPIHGFLVIDARTGNDVAQVTLTNARSRQPPFRPSPDAQGLLFQLQTGDAAHLVLVDLPLD